MDECPDQKVLPHSVEAEQSVIGSMLMDREAIISASEIIAADDFYQHQYGVMFESMVELFNENRPVDLITLQNRLKEKDVPPEVSSLDFVTGHHHDSSYFGQCKIICKHCAGESCLRRLIKVNERHCQHVLRRQKEPLETILATTEKTVFDWYCRGIPAISSPSGR